MSVEWTSLVSGGIGGIVIKAVGDVTVAALRRRRAANSAPDMTTQFSVLLKANNEYREEVRKDMETMRTQMKDMQCSYENQLTTMQNKYDTKISQMKEQYEKEISELKSEMLELIEKISEYRRENGALHLLLKNRGIETPEWIKRAQE